MDHNEEGLITSFCESSGLLMVLCQTGVSDSIVVEELLHCMVSELHNPYLSMIAFCTNCINAFGGVVGTAWVITYHLPMVIAGDKNNEVL